jgi:hypothetical protein
MLLSKGDDFQASQHYRTALELQPDWPPVLAEAARLFATSTDPRVRNPEDAVRYAERAVALTYRRDPALLELLALAKRSAGLTDR